MTLYRIRIINHNVIGYPYVPICKFHLSSLNTKNKITKIQQSSYINPPIYNPSQPNQYISNKQLNNQLTNQENKFINSKNYNINSHNNNNNSHHNNNNSHNNNINSQDKQIKQVKQGAKNDSNYMRQFPIEFSILFFKLADQIQIKLIQLTKNGRQKQIGYSKITINKQVINKHTKHRIMQYNGELNEQQKTNNVKNNNLNTNNNVNRNNNNVNTNNNTQYQHVISVLQVQLYPFKHNTNQNNNQQINQYNKINSKRINQFKVNDNQSQSQSQQKQSIHNYDQSQNGNHQYQNQKFVFQQSQQSSIHNQSIIQNKPIYNQSKQQRRILQPQSSQHQSSHLISRQSKSSSRNSISGKIVKQKILNNNMQSIIQIPNKQEYKHKRRIKYIFSTSQIQPISKVIVQQKRTQELRQQTLNNQINNNKLSRKDIQKINTQQNQTTNNQLQLIQYFISNYQTNQNGCNTLTNLNIIYQSSFGPFYPKYITLLTYKLYQKIIKINCQQINNQSKEFKHHKQQQRFVLEDQSGQLREPQVYNKFSHLKIYLPKYCLVLRVQIILEDQSVYTGTLSNQCGFHIKSALQLKITNKRDCQYIKKQKQRIIMIANISQGQTNKQLSMKKNQDHAVNSSTIQNSPIKSPNKGTQYSSHSRIQCFPKVQRKYKTQQNEIDEFLNYSTLDDNPRQRRKQKSPIQKTLNAINAYKICLMPGNSTQHESKQMKYESKNRKEQIVNNDRYSSEKKQMIKKQQQIKIQHQSRQQSFTNLLQNGSQQSSQQNINEIYKFKRTLQKDLPKIIVQRSSNYNLLDSRKIALLQNMRQDMAIKTRKKNKNSQGNQFYSKNKIRLDFLKKILGNKYSDYQQKHHGHYQSNYLSGQSSHQRSINMNADKKTNKSRTKACLQQQLRQDKRRHKRLMELPYGDFSSTKAFPTSKKKNNNKISSCHQKCVQRLHTTKQMKGIKYIRVNNGSLDSIDGSRSDLKKRNRLNILIRKIQYLKLVDNNDGQNNKRNSQDNKNKVINNKEINYDDGQSDSNNSNNVRESKLTINDQQVQIFMKIYNTQSKRNSQFITSSQLLSQAFKDNPYNKNNNLLLYKNNNNLSSLLSSNNNNSLSSNKNNNSSLSKKKLSHINNQKKLYHINDQQQCISPLSLKYLTCTWNLKNDQFIFKSIKISDLITVQVYGDLSHLDNHQFMGKCIFTVQQISYMRIQKKITGYLIKNNKIQSHCTLYFDIEEVI